MQQTAPDTAPLGFGRFLAARLRPVSALWMASLAAGAVLRVILWLHFGHAADLQFGFGLRHHFI